MNTPLVLPDSLKKKGYGLVWSEETVSTNADALKSAQNGQLAECWFVSKIQKAGRGRNGRHWVSPAGNLYASLMLRNPCDMLVASQLGFIAGIALWDTVFHLTNISPLRLRLKWPNDLLLDGRKLAGLLLEAQTLGDNHIIVIGWGVNVQHCPEGLPYPVMALKDIKPSLSVSALFERLSFEFDRILSFWKKSKGRTPQERFASIRLLWLERAVARGEIASVTLPHGKIQGTFTGIDGYGRLEIQTETGMTCIDAGDVFFPNLVESRVPSNETD